MLSWSVDLALEFSPSGARDSLSELEQLRRALENAKKRVRYWGAVPMHYKSSFSIKTIRTKTPNARFQDSMAEVNELSRRIAKITGRQPPMFLPGMISERPTSTFSI